MFTNIDFINKFKDIKLLVQSVIGITGFELIRKDKAEQVSQLPHYVYLFNKLTKKKKEKISRLLTKSTSQLAQDLFVAANSEPKNQNFFVEFGATDGVTNSNTLLLEKELGWNGILVEPATIWQDALTRNRLCKIDKRCVYPKSGQYLTFLEVDNEGSAEPGLSGLKEFANNGDWASRIRLSKSTKSIVETISLNDLLDFHKAPKTIDYMSIDTEGSELEILKSYNFNERKINIITVEHNWHKNNRSQIYQLLTSKGYIRVLEEISLFDDWYILENLLQKY